MSAPDRRKECKMELPLVLVTNDDGIRSRGLWAVVEALPFEFIK